MLRITPFNLSWGVSWSFTIPLKYDSEIIIVQVQNFDIDIDIGEKIKDKMEKKTLTVGKTQFSD